ncbi:hypothetical protein ACB092_08G085100 [Castanea dentata]
MTLFLLLDLFFVAKRITLVEVLKDLKKSLSLSLSACNVRSLSSDFKCSATIGLVFDFDFGFRWWWLGGDG